MQTTVPSQYALIFPRVEGFILLMGLKYAPLRLIAHSPPDALRAFHSFQGTRRVSSRNTRLQHP